MKGSSMHFLDWIGFAMENGIAKTLENILDEDINDGEKAGLRF